MFNVQCSIFLLVSESTPFLALPGKHLPRAQIIFVVRAGRKYRIFSLTLQRYKKFNALPNYSSKKARKKARSRFFKQIAGKNVIFVIFVICHFRFGFPQNHITIV